MPLNINWQQILIHLFNFFLLLALLTHLVYEPILSFIKKREEYFLNLDKTAKEKVESADKLIEENKKIFENSDVEIKRYKEEKLQEVNKLVAEKTQAAIKEADKIVDLAKEKATAEYHKVMEKANKDIRKMAIETTKRLVHHREVDIYDEFVDHFHVEDVDHE